MGAILVIIAVATAGWLYEPLVYENFEVRITPSSPVNAPDVTARTCIYLSGFTLVSHTLNGTYNYACPRRRGAAELKSPGSLID